MRWTQQTTVNKAVRWRWEFDYDLVVLDLSLPGVDGLSILKSVRQRKTNLPVMILTARSRVEDRVQCLDNGRGRLPGEAVLVS